MEYTEEAIWSPTNKSAANGLDQSDITEKEKSKKKKQTKNHGGKKHSGINLRAQMF